MPDIRAACSQQSSDYQDLPKSHGIAFFSQNTTHRSADKKVNAEIKRGTENR
jgi:hypothetical protein